MVDPLETIIAYLKADPDVAALVSGRVAVKQKFATDWTAPSKAIQVRYDGGAPDLYTERQIVRLELRCYAESQFEASYIHHALISLMRATDRALVEMTEGNALVYWLVPTSGASFLQDPDVGVDMILFFASACMAEEDIA